MPLRALADLGIPYYDPAKSDQGYYSGVQCRLAKSHRQDSSLVCADLKTENGRGRKVPLEPHLSEEEREAWLAGQYVDLRKHRLGLPANSAPCAENFVLRRKFWRSFFQISSNCL
ncbi:unnamed protein product [Vicia faba]|uniref:Uncharacterized protein n=1 Tax=Vicia faba TaxID=3906 RepID=A0AAV0ZSH6_VICFA|nr:unnamed protein product [Vicia faba]